MKILVIDIGNTNATLSVYSSGRVGAQHRMATACRKITDICKLIENTIQTHTIDAVIYGSVVPDIDELWNKAITKVLNIKPLVVSHKLKLSVKLAYPYPEKIGADRLANACGAVSLYGAPVIVADFGTALTFDVVSTDSAYIGGVIAPGLPLMFDYLSEKTALLPHIEPRTVKRVVGKSTEEAMQIGARWGYRGMVSEILSKVRSQLHNKDVTVCATGGYASWVLKGMENIHYEPDLTLLGLGRIYELNSE